VTATPRSFNAPATEAMAVPQMPMKWMERAWSMVTPGFTSRGTPTAYRSQPAMPSGKAWFPLG